MERIEIVMVKEKETKNTVRYEPEEWEVVANLYVHKSGLKGGVPTRIKVVIEED